METLPWERTYQIRLEDRQMVQNRAVATNIPSVPGRGLSIGASRFIAASQDCDGNVTLCEEQNTVLQFRRGECPATMLTRLNVPYVRVDGQVLVFGEAARGFSDVVNKEPGRILGFASRRQGHLTALTVEKLVMGSLLGRPVRPGEVCCYSMPAQPADGLWDPDSYSALVEGILLSLGYTPQPVLEGEAVVLSELADDGFTGAGLSFGAGMVHLCVAVDTKPIFSVSVMRGGDWIDQQAARALGMSPSRVRLRKERGIDLYSPQGREEEAIAIYYQALLRHFVQAVWTRYAVLHEAPRLTRPLPVVLGGGSAMVHGFVDAFRGMLAEYPLPFPVLAVRLASEPLQTVARGCLIKALLNEEKRGNPRASNPY